MNERCASCGAPLVEAGQLFCPQCGAQVARGVADLERYRTAAERFDRVAVAPGHARALAHTPTFRAAREVGGPLVRLVASTGAVIVLAVLAIRSRDWKFIAFVVVASSIWLGVGVRGFLVALARLRAPLRRPIAVVMDDRFAPRGTGSDPARVGEHRVTLQEQDGTSRVVFANGALMGDVGVGDIGVAYARADRLLDYRWVDVMAPPLAAGEPPRAAACTSCGAHPRFGPVSERCAFCGAPLPVPDLGEFGARFRAAAASPAAHAATRRVVSGGVPSLFPALALLAGGSFFAWVAYQLRDAIVDAVATSAWFLLVLAPPAVVLVAGLFRLWRLTAPRRAPRQNELAVVVRTRTAEERTLRQEKQILHFATVASPSGARRELRALPRLAGRLARGQLGVAHLRGDWLADFTPLDPHGETTPS